MTENPTKKNQPSSPNMRLPDELHAALRKEAALYLDRGLKPPAFGEMLLEAWRAHKSLPEPPPGQFPDQLRKMLADRHILWDTVPPEHYELLASVLDALVNEGEGVARFLGETIKFARTAEAAKRKADAAPATGHRPSKPPRSTRRTS